MRVAQHNTQAKTYCKTLLVEALALLYKYVKTILSIWKSAIRREPKAIDPK